MQERECYEDQGDRRKGKTKSDLRELPPTDPISLDTATRLCCKSYFEKLPGFDCKRMIPSLNSTYPWLKGINSQSLQESTLNLEKAYQRFFKKLGDYPKHKKKRGRRSFTVPQHFSVKGNYLFIPKLKTGLKVNFHRPLAGAVKSCTISREPSDKYFVSFSVESPLGAEVQVFMPELIARRGEQAIDLRCQRPLHLFRREQG